MSSSSATTHLGRRFWTSFRESVETVAGRLSARQKSLGRPVSGQLTSRAIPSSNPRFQKPSRFFSSSSSKISPSHVRRSCTSGGLLLLTVSSPSSSAPAVVSSCSAAADAALGSAAAQKSGLVRLAHQAWKRNVNTSSRVTERRMGRRCKSTKADGEYQRAPGKQKTDVHKAPDSKPEAEHHDPESVANSMSKYLQSHLPHLPHRPTKEELLQAANGFWQRMKVRFKWFSIRSMRPWNADEWGAFVSMFVLGHLAWILVGTTTFFSLVILTVNTVFAQEELATWIGDYLTHSAGVTVIFESAIVPKWRDGVITFRNVFVSRRPGQSTSSVRKGSSTDAAAAAEAAAKQVVEPIDDEDDGNYTQYDITIDAVNVTLSFLKWWNGKGLLKDVEVKGVRGVVDRTSVRFSGEPVDPRSYRHEHQPGDFEIEHFKLEDLLVTIHQPDGFRPFPVSIYSCELPQLRKQWLFYDFLAATHMSGSFDGSLFTIHPRQIHGVATSNGRPVITTDQIGEPSAWKKFSRIRIDGMKIDHLNRGVEGPFGWIYEGNVDIVADMMFPVDIDESIGKVMSDFYDKMEEAVTSNRYLKILDTDKEESPVSAIDTTIYNGLEKGHLTHDTTSPDPDPDFTHQTTHIPSSPVIPAPSPVEEVPRYLVTDLRLHLNDVRAAVPFFPPSDSLGHSRTESYINAALIRPIVAYINAKRTYIPITCRIVKRAADFDGSWTVYDCGMMDDSSAEVYAAFARDVEDQQSRVRRLKKVGFWTLSMIAHALLAGVAGDLM